MFILLLGESPWKNILQLLYTVMICILLESTISLTVLNPLLVKYGIVTGLVPWSFQISRLKYYSTSFYVQFFMQKIGGSHSR